MKTIIAAILILGFCQVSIAQKTTVDSRLQGLDAELEKVLKAWKAAGFAVAVIEKDKLLYARGFGVKNVQTREAVTANTLFAIGSCTKAFTATLIGGLAADGKLSYDEPVRKYLPDLRFFNNDMNNLITLRDMMSHRTGLPRHDLSWYLSPTTRDSLIQRIAFQEPTFRPKERYQYNNFMFLAQGVVVEKLSGKSWEQNMKDKLLNPLGMVRTNMPYDAVKNDNDVASPHDFKKDSSLRVIPHYNIAGMGPAGAVYSSVTEMSKWVQAWIYGGKFNGREVIPATHYKEAITAQVATGGGLPEKEHPDVHFNAYGFGWGLASYRGHYRVEHGGAIDGFIASTCFFPTDSIGIVVLSNQGVRQITAIVRNIVTDRMLGLTRTDWNTEIVGLAVKAKKEADSAKAKATFTRAPGTKPSHDLPAYAGLYTHPGYGTYEVYASGDSLMARSSKFDLWLEHWNYDVFVPWMLDPKEKPDTANRPSFRFRFNTGTNGDIESLHATGFEAPGILLEFKKTEKPKPLGRAELEGYTGEYLLMGQTAKVYIVEEKTLTVEVPGQPPYALTPVGNHRFNFRDVPGFSVLFEKAAGKPAEAMTFIQPQGNFKATRKP